MLIGLIKSKSASLEVVRSCRKRTIVVQLAIRVSIHKAGVRLATYLLIALLFTIHTLINTILGVIVGGHKNASAAGQL